VAALVDRLRGSGSPVIGQRPDPEQQYLLTLIANLEATGGVSQYVALDAELHSTDSERDVVIPRGVSETRRRNAGASSRRYAVANCWTRCHSIGFTVTRSIPCRA
jgi:hypothetical protein